MGETKNFSSPRKIVSRCVGLVFGADHGKKTLLQNRKKERARKKDSPPPPSLLFPFFRGPTYLSYFHGYHLPCLSRSYNVDRQLNSFPPPSSFLSSHLASAALPQKLSRGGPKPKHLFFSSLNFLLYDPGIGRWRKIRPGFNMYLLDHPFSLRFFLQMGIFALLRFNFLESEPPWKIEQSSLLFPPHFRRQSLAVVGIQENCISPTTPFLLPAVRGGSGDF